MQADTEISAVGPIQHRV